MYGCKVLVGYWRDGVRGGMKYIYTSKQRGGQRELWNQFNTDLLNVWYLVERVCVQGMCIPFIRVCGRKRDGKCGERERK